ncbi:MAG: type II toxin-antitoxin system HicB family antitoxin [Bacillota bacterium]|jgi:predicted RNase H-like HicB family nuclease
MKRIYPVILIPQPDGYAVDIPDLDINTQGKDQLEALAMARDAIGLMGITLEDDKRSIPEPNSKRYSLSPDDILSIVEIDFDKYRQEDEQRVVRRNVTIPAYLDKMAKDAKVNVSGILTDALKNQFKIN